MTFTYNENFIYDNVEIWLFVVVLSWNTLRTKSDSRTECKKKNEIIAIDSHVVKQDDSFRTVLLLSLMIHKSRCLFLHDMSE